MGYVDKVIRRADGRLQLIVRYGGFLGFGARLIAVPAESMLLLGPELEIIDLIPTQLGALATFTDVDAVSLAPDAVIRLGIVGPSH